jgi:hypothetical protein
MILPVPGLDEIRTYWFEFRRGPDVRHGILVYDGNDHRFPEYMASQGFKDLEGWSRDFNLRLFILQSPPEAWIKYVEKKRHFWFELLRKTCGASFTHEAADRAGSLVVSVNGQRKTLKELFVGPDSYEYRDVIDTILAHFQLPRPSHPCVILFKDFAGRDFWTASLQSLLNLSVGEIHELMEAWFAGSDLKKWAKG